MKQLIYGLFTVYLFLTLSACSKPTEIKLPTIFSDNLVLQQNSNAAIWGKATPGAKISVSASWGANETTIANADSTWQLVLPTVEAGGSYMLTISATNTVIEIKNILLGEVWLASGQSNMEMPLSGWLPHDPIQNSEEAIATANYPEIRMFTVVKRASSVPLDDVKGRWDMASPETAAQFSATAYFFARKLHTELGVPVGIIHSSWGGTPAEAWVSGKMLAIDQDFQEIITQLDAYAPEEKAYLNWLKTHKTIDITLHQNGTDPLTGIDLFNSWALNNSMNISEWPVMQLPIFIERTELGDFDGAIWFRKEIEISSEWENQELTLSLGPIDDRDVTWFNGIQVGSTDEEGLYQQNRVYTVPANLVTAGKAVVSVRVVDNRGGGGIYGDANLLKIHPVNAPSNSISLAGEWHYKVVAEIQGESLYVFDPETNQFDQRPERTLIVGSQTPSALYNGMIAPLVPFTLRGAIWYQGESNVGRANQYMRLKSMLVTDWRNQFDNETMPFYYVQIAPWRYGDAEGTSSANLREAQRRMLVIPNTGMAVTLDIGNVDNIHPANKSDVGERLALWALFGQYNRAIAFRGPEPEAVTINGNELIISFSHVAGGLHLKDDVPNQFELAGNDGMFHPATAAIKDDKIVLKSSKVTHPVSARYAYRNGSVASLFNKAGLPAPSFSTENEIPN